MKNLSSLLLKFKNIKDPKEELMVLSKLISEVIDKHIDQKEIILKGDIVYLHVSPYIKTEVYLKKDAILEHLKNNNFSKIVDLR